MWKKVLAIVCIPVAGFFTLALLPYAIYMAQRHHEGSPAFLVSYVFFSLLFLAGWIIGVVFWWRWILRVLKSSGASEAKDGH